MQWLKDDKIKHRVIGLAVLLSFAVVFIPAMVKKSNQQLDKKMHLALNLPSKPAFPKVTAVKPTVLFETIKVAHVVIPSVNESKGKVEIARAESLSDNTMPNKTILQKAPILASPPQGANKHQPVVALVIPSKSTKKVNLNAELKKELYSVQLASFSQQDNAQSLVEQLNKQGYKASYDKLGSQYRVLVGQLDQLGKAKNLQQELATETRMKGFVVKAG